MQCPNSHVNMHVTCIYTSYVNTMQVAYVAWSVSMTQLAAEARKRVNVLDNATSAKAVDALLNYGEHWLLQLHYMI